MDSTVIVTLITVVGGMLFYVLQKVVDKRYNKAKEAVESNSSTILDMTKVVKGFRELNDQYERRLQEQDHELQEKEQRIQTLEQQIERMGNAGKDFEGT